MREVTKRFGGVTAVDKVSLAIGGGEFLTLLGPSGCGKTTLLRMISGFEAPDEGKVLLGGRDVSDVPPYRRDVTTVFQQYALFPHMNVQDNIAFGLQRKRAPRQEVGRRVEEALEMVRLAGLGGRRIDELSGGQQQRVALARALVVEPRVLLLDEPLAALDLKLRKQMQIELKGLQRRLGISFVYVTHDQEEALTMSDRIVVMNAGRVEQVGSAEQVYERPATEFVAGFIGMSNLIEGVVESAAGDFLTVALAGARFEVIGAGAGPGERVRAMVRPEKINLVNRDVQPSIEAVVESAVYMGESTQLRVRLTDGQELMVVEQNRSPFQSARHRTGEAVRLAWDRESAILLR